MLKFEFFVVGIFFMIIGLLAKTQELPEYNVNTKETLIVGSGVNQILIQNLDIKDTSDSQLVFDVVSSDQMIATIDSVVYNFREKLAIIWISEKGILGETDLTINVRNSNGTTRKNTVVSVETYQHHGAKFEIHDAIFWQEVVPLDDTPVFDSIIQSTNMKVAYDDLNWDDIELTVSAGCNSQWCDGHDFSTGFLKGYIVPEKSGNYNFYINGDSDYALFLSTNENFESSEVIAAKSDKHGKVGEIINGRKSEPLALDSGNVYAFYAVQWNVHNENGGVQWELPGTFGPKHIKGSQLYSEWDTQRPDRVDSVRLIATGDDFLKVLWNESSDDQRIVGYNIYLNGKKVNSTPISSTRYLISGLQFETQYSISVTAIDAVKNESLMSEIVNAITSVEDTIAPNPPDGLNIDVASGLALKISWEGATDDLSGVIGYNVYLNGDLFNPDEILYSNSTVLKVLKPQTSYQIHIEAIDGGLNVSAKSEVFNVVTPLFDPLDENLGLKTGKVEFLTDAISFNEGLGINTNYKNGDVFNATHTELFKDLAPGAIRWGALTANPLSFSDYAGAGKNVTIGKFFERCNNLEAYTVFCCGVENSTDWIKDDETFIRFLEYVNGPNDTEGGKMRFDEGYSEPFLKNSKGLIFEFGNEVWGGNSHNAQIGENYTNYAEWCRKIARKMRASEYFDSTKIVLVYSARYPGRENSYGLNDKIILGDKGEVDWIGPSGYLGGNLNYDPAFPPAASELEYYQNVRNRADEYLAGIYQSHKFEVENTGRIFKQYMYESNTTTPTYNGRLGQALLSTDYYLTAMELGSAIPTLFHLTGGQWRITEPENDYKRLPLFVLAKYFNKLCKGDVLDNKYYSNTGSISKPGATFKQRSVGVHSYRNNEAYTLVLISRDYENDHFVQLDLPNDLEITDNGTIYQITGEDFNDKNVDVNTIELQVQDNMIVKVPKFGMVFIRFRTAEMKMKKLPLAFFSYPRMEELSIYAPKNTFTKPNEKLSFRAYIKPENSWDKELVWTLLNNSGNYTLSTLASYCYVYSGNYVANESDSLILRVANRPGTVFDEVVLYPPEVPVGINKNKNNSAIRVFPNPAKNYLQIHTNKNDVLEIYSLGGSKIFSKKLHVGNNRISTSHLNAGVYTLKFSSNFENVIISK